MNHRLSPIGFAVVGVLSLSGCFGGSSSGSGGDSESEAVSGTAATGAPLSEAEVCLSTSNQDGCAATTTTDEDGRYSFSESDLEGLETPFAITVEGEDAGGDQAVLRSIAESKDGTTSNITPLSELVLSGALNEADLSDLDPDSAAEQDLGNTQQAVRAILENADILSKLDIASNIDMLGDVDFQANRTGLDRLLDLVDISTYEADGDGNLGIQITDLGNRTQRLVVERTNGGLQLNDASTDFSDALNATEADLSGIGELFSDLGTLLGEDADASEFEALVHQDFLDLGMDRTKVIDEMRNEKFLFEDVEGLGPSFDVNGCETAQEDVVCQAKVMMLDAEGNRMHPLDVAIIETADGWKLWGNQREHDLELQPYAMHQDGQAPELGVQFQLNSGSFESAEVSSTESGSAEKVFTWKEGEDNRIAMDDAELDEVRKGDGHYKIELYDSNDLNGGTDKTYSDIALDSLPFMGAPEAFENRFPELTDESQQTLDDLSPDADNVTVALDLQPTTRIQEMTISVPTSESCSYKLEIDAHNIEPEQTLDLRNSDIGCPDGSFDGSQAEVSTVTVDAKGRYYFKGPAY